MKYLILLPFYLLLSFPLQSQGIQFEHTTWQEIKAKAKAENKIIFIDAFTTWCGPCKKMSSQTFPDKTVGDLYNANFINVKMDMEKGEGIGLAQEYAVNLYPTLLFIDGDGAVVHRTAGFYPVKEFLELGQLVLAPEKTLKGMEAKYKAGDRTPELLLDLMSAKAAAYEQGIDAIADEYLKTQGDMGSDKNMDIIYQYAGDPYSIGFQYLIKNRKQFENKFGIQQVAGKIEQSFQEYISNKPDISLEEVDKLFMIYYPEDGPRMSSQYRITDARKRGDREGFAKAAIAHYEKYPSKDAEELNEIAWTFFKVVDDKKMLKTALKWAKKSAKISDVYTVNDTIASLYYKLKKKKSAIKYAKKSIEQATAVGEDYSQTQTLLDEIYKL